MELTKNRICSTYITGIWCCLEDLWPVWCPILAHIFCTKFIVPKWQSSRNWEQFSLFILFFFHCMHQQNEFSKKGQIGWFHSANFFFDFYKATTIFLKETKWDFQYQLPIINNPTKEIDKRTCIGTVFENHRKSLIQRCERSYVYTLNGQKLIKNAKNDPLWQVLKICSLRSNRVIRQVSFNRTKIGGKCQISNATYWVIFKQCAYVGKYKSIVRQCVEPI